MTVSGKDSRLGPRGHSRRGATPLERPRSGRLSAIAISLAVLLASALLNSAPALAQSQRGHAFSFAFGEKGAGEGQLNRPSGIAVNDATGEVYVADAANNRVQEFEPQLGPHGELLGEHAAGSFKVRSPRDLAVDNSKGPSAGDVYVVAADKSEAEEEEPEENRIDKFSATGTALAKLVTYKLEGEKEELEDIHGVAVDPSGNVFVSLEETVVELDGAEKNETVGIVKLPSEGRRGLALDSAGHLYVGVEEAGPGSGSDPVREGLEDELTEAMTEEDEADGIPEPDIGVITQLDGSSGAVTAREIDAEDSPAVAVSLNPKSEPADEDEHDDVYLANLTVVGSERRTTIAAFSPPSPSSPDGALIQRFSAPGLKDSEGLAVDSSTGTVYVADAGSDDVDVFELESPGAPTVSDLSACTLQTSSEGGCTPAVATTTLKAEVDPRGADTHYHFEFGPGVCSAVPSTCTATPEQDIPASFSEQPAHTDLHDLPSGSYRYRIVASNEFGAVESAEGTFVVLASVNGLADNREWELVTPPPGEKVGATPEAITGAGGLIQAAANGEAISYVARGTLPSNGQPEGNRNPEYTQVLSSRSSAGWSSQDISTSNTSGEGVTPGALQEYQAFSPNLALALLQPFPGTKHSGGIANPPLSPLQAGEEPGTQEKTPYLRADTPEALLQPGPTEQKDYEDAAKDGAIMGNAGFLALLTHRDSPGGEPFGGGSAESSTHEGIVLLGETPDLSHVVVASHRAVPGLYEWDRGPEGAEGPEGSVQLVSELPKSEETPDGTRVTADEAEIGGPQGVVTRNAVSEEGTLVFWTDQSNGHLYVRDTVTHETLKLDTVQSEEGASGEGKIGPLYQTASLDGSKVFFTDTQRLTAESKAGFGEPGSDLYVAELSGGRNPGEPLAQTLTDLTPEGENGEAADVMTEGGATRTGGGVLGASEDGSHVFFVADGALSPDATRGFCSEEARPRGTTCNLYERSHLGGEWTPTKLIAVLSDEDEPDWGGATGGELPDMTASVSPNGEYLAFMSDRSLTGYDNEDVTSEEAGEQRLDEEVFLYDAHRERLVCVSCNPDGTPPAGILDTRSSTKDGLGLLVDRFETWALGRGEGETSSKEIDHWLAGNIPGWTSIDFIHARYQSRYLSNTGRLYFDSPGPLVPAATSDKEKVYQYEPGGEGTCTSEGGCVSLLSAGASEHEAAFLDASLSGDDVFFLTAEGLVQQDTGEEFDVYDAHVCPGTTPCMETPSSGTPPCLSLAECRPGGSTPAPAAAAPATTGPAVSGNVSQVKVLSSTSSAPPKPLTRAQKLAKALKSCHRIKRRRPRLACEAQARKRYRAPAKHAAHKSSTKGRQR